MATLNPAEWFRLRDRGAIAPGKRADLVVFSNPSDFRAEMVFSAGRIVARDGAPAGEWPEPQADASAVLDSVNVDWGKVDLGIPVPGGVLEAVAVRVIGVVPDHVFTRQLVMEVPVRGGKAVADPARDVLKMAVVERHRGSGNVGFGFVQGIGLKRGALAGSVGHDAHNLVVVGCDDVSMMTAIRAVDEMGGGLVAVEGETVLASVPLPIAGLMTDEPVASVRKQMDGLLSVAAELGSTLHDPLMTLGFLPLEVIPELRLTDKGLVDVGKFDLVSLWAGAG